MPDESPAAALAKLRWAGTTQAERSAEMSRIAMIGHNSMTKEQRVARAKKAVAAREAKRAGKKSSRKRKSRQ